MDCRGKYSPITHWRWHYRLHRYYVTGTTAVAGAKVSQPPILEWILSRGWILDPVGKWMFWVFEEGNLKAICSLPTQKEALNSASLVDTGSHIHDILCWQRNAMHQQDYYFSHLNSSHDLLVQRETDSYCTILSYVRQNKCQVRRGSQDCWTWIYPAELQRKTDTCWLTSEFRSLHCSDCAVQALVLFCNNVHRKAAVFLQFILARWVAPSNSRELDHDLRAKWAV